MAFLPKFSFTALAALAVAACASNEPVDPASIGLNAAKLAQVRADLTADIAETETPGAIMLIARGGEVGFYAEAGVQGPDDPTPMNEDTIFRIYSMTKPIVSVAAMSMVEDGLMELDAPIETYVPAYAEMKVIDPATGGVRPATDSITVRDLLRHTSGMIYGVFAPDSPLGKAYLEAEIPSSEFDLDELSRRMSGLPLLFDPGSAWAYSRSTDVLGDVMEAAADKPLDEILEERVLGPLEMTETAFYREPEAAPRVAEPPEQAVPLFGVTDPKPMLSGGGGLTSTIGDYLTFVRMLSGKGALNGVRIIEEDTLAAMTMNQLDGVDRSFFYPGDAYGFGLGFATRLTEDGPYPGSVGDYWWRGYAGTYFWVDPEKDLFAILMVQNPELRNHYTMKAREWVYGALAD